LQPGPLQAFFLSKTVEQGWRRTLPAAFAPIISDGPIVLIALFVLSYLPNSFQHILQIAGGLLLLYFAWSSLRGWRTYQDPGDGESSSPNTIMQAALVNLLNPNPYLGWSLIMGPAVILAWNEKPIFAVTLLTVFYLVMISTSMVIILLVGTTRFLDQNRRRMLLLISALLLVGLGFYYLINGGWALFNLL
jgi:threonine/homoserine/homoserine lactone efflux protein